jgi:hypothetical protein
LDILGFKITPDLELYCLERSYRYERKFDAEKLRPKEIDILIKEYVRKETINREEIIEGSLKATDIQPENVFPELPVLKYSLEGKLPKITNSVYKDWLIFRQIHNAENATKYVENYVDYINMSDEKACKICNHIIQNMYKKEAQEFAISEIKRICNLVLSNVIGTLNDNSSYNKFLNVVSNFCLAGVNIMDFAKKANTPEKVALLVTGQHNGIYVIRDIQKLKFKRRYGKKIKGSKVELTTFQNCWIPKRSKIVSLGWAYIFLHHNPLPNIYDPRKDGLDKHHGLIKKQLQFNVQSEGEREQVMCEASGQSGQSESN